MSTIAVSYAIARSRANATKIGPSRWLAFTFRSAISFERRSNSGPLALIQLIRTTEVIVKAIAHLLPQSEIAAETFAQY
jgi:hypothetical protein